MKTNGQTENEKNGISKTKNLSAKNVLKSEHAKFQIAAISSFIKWIFKSNGSKESSCGVEYDTYELYMANKYHF